MKARIIPSGHIICCTHWERHSDSHSFRLSGSVPSCHGQPALDHLNPSVLPANQAGGCPHPALQESRLCGSLAAHFYIAELQAITSPASFQPTRIREVPTRMKAEAVGHTGLTLQWPGWMRYSDLSLSHTSPFSESTKDSTFQVSCHLDRRWKLCPVLHNRSHLSMQQLSFWRAWLGISLPPRGGQLSPLLKYL